MEAILLCLLLNKTCLFRLTQHGFILIPLVTFTCMLHVSACTEAIRHINTNTLRWVHTSSFVHLYTLRFKEKEKRAVVVAKATVHKQGCVLWFKWVI